MNKQTPLFPPPGYRLLLRSATLVTVFLLSASLFAQVTPQYYLGGGTGSNSFPLNSSSTRKTEHHYLPGEFSGAYNGNITHVYLQRSNTSSSTSSFTGLTIYLAQTTSTSFPSNTTFWTPVTQVYYASSVVVPAGSSNDWFVFPLTTPFPYDPSKSLIVQICQAGYSNGITLRNTSMSTPPYRRIYGASSCAATNGSSNDGYRYSFGFDLVSPLPNNAGITELTAPLAFCAGSHDIKVKLKNFGNNTLSSVTINWSFGGSTQPAINWTGSLAPYAETEVTLGNRSFSAGVPYALVASTSMPNGVIDTDPSNDQLSTTLQAAMSGSYTIGGSSPDYSSFSAAVADLVAHGVCGAVTFNVAAGTYTEQITIPEISGASATNTITFDGGTGNAASRSLQYSAPQYEAVVTLSGADYIRFRNLTINSTNSSYGYGFLFTGQADYNEITDCVMTFPSNSTSYYHQGVAATSTTSYSTYGNHGNYNLIKDNTIKSPGYYGIRWNGSSSTSLTESVGNQFIGNTITDFYYYGLYLYYSSGIRVIDNTVIQRSSGTYTTSSGYAIYVYYPNDGPVVANNYAEAHYNPMRVYYINNATNSTANRGMVYNNMLVGVGTSTVYGLYVSYAEYADIVYNSVNLYNGTSSCYGIYEYGQSSAYDVKVANNYISYTGNGTWYAIYNYYRESQAMFDYNAFWHDGTGSEQWRWDGTYYTSLSALKAAWPTHHQNSVEGNPYFVAQNDLHCRSTVGYLAGTPWPTVLLDFDGEARHPATPCIGADEYPEPPAEYDMAVRKVLVDYATDKWARLEDPAKHKVRVLLENVGLLADPATISVGIADAPMNDIGDAQLVETFSPGWDANHRAVVEFSYEVTGLVPTPNATLYARAFLPNEQKPLNDQASDSHEVFNSKVHGYEDFRNFEDNTNFTYFDGYLDMPWKVLDVNGGDRPMISGEAIVMNGGSNPADEWIFTPGALLLDAASYRIGFTFTNMASIPVTIELSYGTTPDASSMTTFATFSNVGMGTFTAKQLWIAAGEAGDPYFNTPPSGGGMYYLGIHVVTAGTGYSWSMDNIKLDDNPSPPPKIGYAVPGTPIASFIDDGTKPIVVSVTYKNPGLVNKTFQVANTKNIYGVNGDFLWDVESADSWITITKESPDPTLQNYNFTPPRPRQFQTFTMTINPAGMAPGVHVGYLTFYGILFNDDFPPPAQGLIATNQPLRVPVELRIINAGSKGGPQSVTATFAPLTVPGSPYTFIDAGSGTPIATVRVTAGQIDKMTITCFPNQLPQNLARMLYVKRYWQITHTGTGWTADIDFPYADTEASMIFDRSQLRGVRQAVPLGAWEDPITGTTSTSDVLNNYVTVRDLNENNIGGNLALAHPYFILSRRGGTVPPAFGLEQNYPNPFNPSTAIVFNVAEERHVRIAVYNGRGAEVAVPVDGTVAAGRYETPFDASALPSGTYVLRMTAGGFTQTRLMTLSK